MTMAPAMAPASGRARNRASGDLRATRSSVLGGGATGASAVVAMSFPFCAAIQRQRVPRAAYLATASTLLLSTKAGPVNTVAPPPRELPLVRYSHRASTDS